MKKPVLTAKAILTFALGILIASFFIIKVWARHRRR
jgi:hypothetical protein